MSRYTWIIFDADNTLFDFDRAERSALVRTLRAYGIEYTDEVRREYSAISGRLWRAFEAGEMSSQRLRVARFEELLRASPGASPEATAQPVAPVVTHEANTGPVVPPSPGSRVPPSPNPWVPPDGLPNPVGSPVPAKSGMGGQKTGPCVDAAEVSARYIHELGRETCLLPHAEAVVRGLSADHRLLLATNGIADVQRRRFASSVLTGCFEDIVISDEIGVAKPHADFFDEAFRRMGDPAKEHVLIVGDSLSSDIAGGIGYGIDTCWFDLRRIGEDGDVFHDPPLSPTYRISALQELPTILA